ncbi:hypothetical protein ACEWY4_019180 [Coilia grayii]|uniref:Ig-like domain-containing protein n=1 Tax=Coilia grayii TaxID=363190 RepID=A0ABD1JHM5_9TELE
MASGSIWTLALLWIINLTEARTQDIHVTCLYTEDCILPCLFKPVGGEVVRWYSPSNSLLLSSDQNGPQDQNYVNKVAMFQNQVALGNGSLLLQRCQPQDRGRYRCHVTGQQEVPDTTVVVRVEAPMQSLALETTRLSGYEEVLCLTRNVYPAPQLSWSTQPPMAKDAMKYTLHKRETKGLYTLESKLRKLRGVASLTYVCTVSAAYGAQTWRASLTETDMSSTEGGDLTLPCVAPADLLPNFTLTWSFLPTDQSSVILTYNSSRHWVAEAWGGHVQLDTLAVKSGNGSLRLRNLYTKQHTGIYTCSFTAPKHTHVAHIRLNVTSIRSEKVQTEESNSWWIAAVVVAVLAVAMAAIVGIVKLKDDCSQSGKTMEEATMMHDVTSTLPSKQHLSSHHTRIQ